MTIINHLSHSNQLDLLCEIIIRIKPEVYLELGVKKGKTIRSICSCTKRSIGVDINIPKNTKGYEFYEMTTDKFFEKIKKKKISLSSVDVALIDANHSSEYVLRDFYNVLPLLRDQGLIILHDTYPKSSECVNKEGCGDAYKAAWEISIKNISFLECCTLPIHPGLTFIRKRKYQVPWIKI